MKFITIAIFCALLFTLTSCTTEADVAARDSEILRELRTLGVGVDMGSSTWAASVYLLPDIAFGISCEETLGVLLAAMDILAGSGAPGTHIDGAVMSHLAANGLRDAFDYQSGSGRIERQYAMFTPEDREMLQWTTQHNERMEAALSAEAALWPHVFDLTYMAMLDDLGLEVIPGDSMHDSIVVSPIESSATYTEEELGQLALALRHLCDVSHTYVEIGAVARMLEDAGQWLDFVAQAQNYFHEIWDSHMEMLQALENAGVVFDLGFAQVAPAQHVVFQHVWVPLVSVHSSPHIPFAIIDDGQLTMLAQVMGNLGRSSTVMFVNIAGIQGALVANGLWESFLEKSSYEGRLAMDRALLAREQRLQLASGSLQ